MRLVQFLLEKSSKLAKLGVLNNNVIIDCSEGLKSSLTGLLNQKNSLESLKSIVSKAKTTHLLKDVTLLAPISKPSKILCVGLNYKEHCDEMKVAYPAQPVIFNKLPSTITGPFDNIIKPTCTEELDWEVELGIVIGKKAKDVKEENALDYVFGYTVAQDLTARDWCPPDKNGGQWLIGKSMDTFCPLGPCVVTKDEISDPYKLKLKTWVNGMLKQDGTTSEMIHRIDKLISYLSSFMTLHPGDLLLTGTPSGVGISRSPPEALVPGDLIESEIENIGKLSNIVI